MLGPHVALEVPAASVRDVTDRGLHGVEASDIVCKCSKFGTACNAVNTEKHKMKCFKHITVHVML